MFIKITKNKRYLRTNILISCVLLYLIVGCDYSKPKATKLGSPNYLKRFYSKKELDKILKVGMSQQDVVNIWGEPFIKNNHLFVYRLDFEQKITKENKDAIVGFSVRFHNNKAVSWGLIYTFDGGEGVQGVIRDGV